MNTAHMLHGTIYSLHSRRAYNAHTRKSTAHASREIRGFRARSSSWCSRAQFTHCGCGASWRPGRDHQTHNRNVDNTPYTNTLHNNIYIYNINTNAYILGARNTFDASFEVTRYHSCMRVCVCASCGRGHGFCFCGRKRIRENRIFVLAKRTHHCVIKKNKYKHLWPDE